MFLLNVAIFKGSMGKFRRVDSGHNSISKNPRLGFGNYDSCGDVVDVHQGWNNARHVLFGVNHCKSSHQWPESVNSVLNHCSPLVITPSPHWHTFFSNESRLDPDFPHFGESSAVPWNISPAMPVCLGVLLACWNLPRSGWGKFKMSRTSGKSNTAGNSIFLLGSCRRIIFI